MWTYIWKTMYVGQSCLKLLMNLCWTHFSMSCYPSKNVTQFLKWVLIETQIAVDSIFTGMIQTDLFWFFVVVVFWLIDCLIDFLWFYGREKHDLFILYSVNFSFLMFEMEWNSIIPEMCFDSQARSPKFRHFQNRSPHVIF